MLSFLRTPVPRTNTASQNPIYYEDGRSRQLFHKHTDEYLVEHTVPPGSTFFNPPTHFHATQTEHFHVVSGTGLWYFPKRAPSFPTKASAGEGITIPMGAYHRFENASKTEPLVVDIGLDPSRRTAEERFFRNFMGYLDDCRKAGRKPSGLQLLRYLYGVDGPIALPVPGPEALGRAISWLFMVVLGVVVGEWVLGYKASYVEYYNEKEAVE